ncbi:MoaD/ThiS family protein [Candidatus Woesearchaeota archaeon]|nr:MoaD/ThiS family protein [Candidatus Woesearchaeota archaeon]
MKVHIEKEGRDEKLEFNGTVSELLALLKINPETVLVARDDELVTPADRLSNKDKVKILSVISGG